MGYPDNVLAADERVVLHRHPHWKRLLGPVLVLLLSTAVAAFGAGMTRTLLLTYTPALYAAGAACLVAALLALVVNRKRAASVAEPARA